jgi:hypothetical protein
MTASIPVADHFRDDGAWTAKSVEHEKPPDERLRLIHVFGLAMPLSVAQTGMPFASRNNLAEIIQLLWTSIFPDQLEKVGDRP